MLQKSKNKSSNGKRSESPDFEDLVCNKEVQTEFEENTSNESFRDLIEFKHEKILRIKPEFKEEAAQTIKKEEFLIQKPFSSKSEEMEKGCLNSLCNLVKKCFKK